MPPRTLDRLIYIDDSGSTASGLVVYGWVELQPHRWHDVLGDWLVHRKQLWEHYGVPVPAELHMSSYALGRGRISQQVPADFVNENGHVLWKDFGRAVARKSLDALHSIGGLRVGAVYRQASHELAAAARAEVYSELLDRFERELEQSGSLAMVFMDGDGSDASYRDAHRALPRKTRRVIEDPIYTDSKTSQLMQMADHVAWCANAAITRAPKHEFAHDWYDRYLAARDPHRQPLAV